MSYRTKAIAAALLSLATLVPAGFAVAADLPVKAPARPAFEAPFFFIIDDRVTYSYIFSAADPGNYSVRPDGTINGKTPRQVFSFTHFDAWAYGTNFFNISLSKSGPNDPAGPCTKAFSMGPLHNVSFEIGADANTQNNFVGPAKRDVVAGLQFAFDLPYRGFFNVAPLVYWEFSNHNSFRQCGAGFFPNLPGVTCLNDGNTRFDPTWAVETNYYMDLGFLPPNMQYFSISGRAAWYGRKGNEAAPLPFAPPVPLFGNPGNVSTAIEFNSEPIRLTFDASKAMMGQKYSHFLDVWVAYRYWQNKYGLDHNNSLVCNVFVPGGLRSNNSCTESSLYAGVTAKF
jgi:hypothetical protein